MFIHQLRNGVFCDGWCGGEKLKSALPNETIFEYSCVEKCQGTHGIRDEIAKPLGAQGLRRLCGGMIELIVVPPKGGRYYNEVFADRPEGFGSIFNSL